MASALPYDIYAIENYIIIGHICEHTERQITGCPLEQRKLTRVCCNKVMKASVWLLTSKVTLNFLSFEPQTNHKFIYICIIKINVLK